MVSTLQEVLTEFESQMRAAPESANRSLLREGKRALEMQIADEPLTSEVLHSGLTLYYHLNEYAACVALLQRYLKQSLPVEEEAWARWELTDNLALCRRCAEAVETQKGFYTWAREALPPDRLLWVMFDDTQALCWLEEGKGVEWLGLFYEVMQTLPRTPENYYDRFLYLRTASLVLGRMARWEEALQIAERIAALAEEDIQGVMAFRMQMEARISRLNVLRHTKEKTAMQPLGQEVNDLMAERCKELPRLPASEVQITRSLCHNAAAPLFFAGEYPLAIPLFRRAIELEIPTPHSYLWLAASLWQTEKCRSEVLALLEQAAYRDRGKDLWARYRMLPEFQDVADDAEFRRATESDCGLD